MLRTILFCLAFIFCAAIATGRSSPPTKAPATPLDVAKALAESKYKGYKYGSEGDKRIDCTQFVLAVVEKLADDAGKKSALTSQIRQTLVIVLSEEDKAGLQALVEKSDPKIKGVQAALVKAGLGEEVKPADAKPGDLVQYWYKESGKWKGHAGVVEKIENGQATIYGSHKTTLQTEPVIDEKKREGGIGSGPVFHLTDASRRVFVVRWSPS